MRPKVNSLKILRQIHGLTPSKLSAATGIPRWVIYEYEHGWRQMSEKDWLTLMRFFGLEE